MRAAGAIPATIDYHGYKHASCISVNHVVTHGIPSETKILKVGDILNIDVTPKFQGWTATPGAPSRWGRLHPGRPPGQYRL